MAYRKVPDITPQQVQTWAEEGKGIATMAKELGCGYSGLYKRITEDEELKEALAFGKRVRFEGYARTLHEILNDPDEKANVKVQAFDKLQRHCYPETIREAQTETVKQLTDVQLVELIQQMQRKELEERLSEASQSPEEVKVKTE